LRALTQGIHVIGICGSVEKGADELYDQGISALYATKPPDMPLDEAMLRAEELYSITAREVFADLLGSRFSVS
jgi:glycerate kinase